MLKNASYRFAHMLIEYRVTQKSNCHRLFLLGFLMEMFHVLVALYSSPYEYQVMKEL